MHNCPQRFAHTIGCVRHIQHKSIDEFGCTDTDTHRHRHTQLIIIKINCGCAEQQTNKNTCFINWKIGCSRRRRCGMPTRRSWAWTATGNSRQADACTHARRRTRPLTTAPACARRRTRPLTTAPACVRHRTRPLATTCIAARPVDRNRFSVQFCNRIRI